MGLLFLWALFIECVCSCVCVHVRVVCLFWLNHLRHWCRDHDISFLNTVVSPKEKDIFLHNINTIFTLKTVKVDTVLYSRQSKFSAFFFISGSHTVSGCHDSFIIFNMEQCAFGLI